MFIEIPDYISMAINMLNRSGYDAYIVGGCVRDVLLNKTPNDWDICTSALPDEICEIFRNFNLVTSGIKHGTVCVIINHLPVEITTFRIDGDYKDNRRPESVTFSTSIEEDLKRRDFSINAMAYSKSDGITDLNGGTQDLKNKIIRCVGNPQTRFSEDALRIMRGLRFAGQLGFTIEKSTKDAIFNQKELLKNISAERITDEFTKLIMSDSFLEILTEYEDVIKVFLPAFSANFSLKSIKKDLTLRLAYILSASEPRNMFGCLKLPKKICLEVKLILENRNTEISSDKVLLKRLLNRFGSSVMEKIIDFKSLVGEDTETIKGLLKKIITNDECYSIRQLEINGSDILSLGAKGDIVGFVLEALLECVITENIENKKDALIAYAKKIIKEHS